MEVFKRDTLIVLFLFLCLQCDGNEAEETSEEELEYCRLSTRQAQVPADIFRSYACAECFYFIYGIDPLYSKKYFFHRCPFGIRLCEVTQFEDLLNCNCRNGPLYNLPEFSNQSTPLSELILEPPLPNDFLRLTRDCCVQAETCCKKVMARKKLASAQGNGSTGVTSVEGSARRYCPATWDGWQCFPETEAGITYRGICPYYSYGRVLVMSVIDSNQHYSTKRCLDSGEWFQRNSDDVDKEWTEYGTCETSNYHEELAKYIVGLTAFGVSVMAILPALVIFSAYRALRNPRVAIHKNLLFSFFLIGIFYIFNNVFFVQRSDIGEQASEETNYVTCRLLFTIQLRFLRLATYMWQLNEGLYLYRLLVHAFAPQQSLRLYYFLGWVFPIIPTVAYTCVKYFSDSAPGVRYDDFLRRCWIPYDNDWVEWITYGPCILSLVINLLLMVVIMRVLIKKLRHNPENEPAQYRKAVRATLVLLPVFGLHFFITIYRMRSVLVYDLMNRVLDGLQGFLVAVIICYTNGEVLTLLRATCTKIQMKRACKKETAQCMKTYHHSQSVPEPEQLNPLLR